MYLIDFTELQYSTLMCVFESKGEYGTTHRLSTSTSLFLTFKVMDLPPSSIDRRRLRGYPSFPVIVSGSKSRGYRFVHFPSDMHGELLLSKPHGECSRGGSMVAKLNVLRSVGKIGAKPREGKTVNAKIRVGVYPTVFGG